MECFIFSSVIRQKNSLHWCSSHLALSRVVIPDEVDVDDLSVLGEDGQEVALGQLVGDAAQEDPGRILEEKSSEKHEINN